METGDGKLNSIKKDKDGIGFAALEHAAFNLIYQYAVMAVNLSEEDICHVLLYNILCVVQYFKFDAFLIPIKKQLIIRLTIRNLFTINFSVACNNRFDNEDKLSLSPTGTSLCKDFTPKLDAYSYAKFTVKVINNEAIYFAAAVSKEKELIAELA